MGEHHRVDESDALSESRGDQVRAGRQQPGPEEDRASGGDRQVEPLEQPQSQQGLDDEASAQRVETEQGSQGVDDPPRLAQRRASMLVLLERCGQPAVQPEGDQAKQRIHHEHGLQRLAQRNAATRRDELRYTGAQRTGGPNQRAHQAVTRKERGALPGRDGARQRGLLQWQKHAHVA